MCKHSSNIFNFLLQAILNLFHTDELFFSFLKLFLNFGFLDCDLLLLDSHILTITVRIIGLFTGIFKLFLKMFVVFFSVGLQESNRNQTKFLIFFSSFTPFRTKKRKKFNPKEFLIRRRRICVKNLVQKHQNCRVIFLLFLVFEI